MLSMSREAKPGSWQTVKKKEVVKKDKQDDKKDRDRLGVKLPDAFADFDKAFAQRSATEKQELDRATYKGTFANLDDEAPGQDNSAADDEAGSSGDDSPPAQNRGAGAPAAAPKAKAPKQPKKPKASVTQVAEGLDVAGLQCWMAEVQARYSTNETAQLEALSDRLLSAFKEASLDLAKILANKGLNAATAQPIAEVPNALMNALASFVAAMSEVSLVQMTIPLTVAVVNEVAGGSSGAAPAGKGKAGLLIILAVMLRTRPQALVQAAPELRKAGRQLTGGNRLPVLLWIVNQAATADQAAGVAVWVRLLLPQLLGLVELPSTTTRPAATAAVPKASSFTPAGLTDDLLRPLEVSLQGMAVAYLSGLLSQLEVDSKTSTVGGDITCGDGQVEPTVPGSAVELLSRLIAGKPITAAPSAEAPKNAPGAAAAAAVAAADSKKAAAARSAAASALEPLLSGLTALAASTSCEQQYSEWLLLALESAAQSSGDPESPDALVERSAANVVSCLCGSPICFGLWESKHKGQLRGSARILAALLQQPQLLKPLQQQPEAAQSFRELLAALPGRHRTHLAAGKGWQGACARVAEDACNKLPKKVRGRGWKLNSRLSSGVSQGGSIVLPLLGMMFVLASIVIMLGLYRHEVAGIMQAYAGKNAAEKLDHQVLVPLEGLLEQAKPHCRQLQQALKPTLAKLQEAAAPAVMQAWERVEPTAKMMQEQLVGPAMAGAHRFFSYAGEQLRELLVTAKSH